MATNRRVYLLRVEVLESRWVPTAETRLDIVSLHEFGHALGLEHHADPASIMHEDYHSDYQGSFLANDPAVVFNPTDGYRSLLEIYSQENIVRNETPWKDTLDRSPGNGIVEVSYSIMPDGTKIKKKVNVIDASFTPQMGNGWVTLMQDQMMLWSAASQGRVQLYIWQDSGHRFNVNGLVQNDPRFGDIRIGAIPMDGPGGKLANTYAPPPNGVTAAGDVHFDALESWILPPIIPPSDGGGGSGDGMGTDIKIDDGSDTVDDDPTTDPPPPTDNGDATTSASGDPQPDSGPPAGGGEPTPDAGHSSPFSGSPFDASAVFGLPAMI